MSKDGAPRRGGLNVLLFLAVYLYVNVRTYAKCYIYTCVHATRKTDDPNGDSEILASECVSRIVDCQRSRVSIT